MKKGRCHRNYRNYIAWLSSCLSWWKKSAQLEIKWHKMILSDQAWQQSPSTARGAGAFPLPLAASQKRYLCYNSYALSHSQLHSLSVALDRVKDISFYSISCSGPTPVWPDANSWVDTGDVLWAFNKNHVEWTPEEEGRGRELVSLTPKPSDAWPEVFHMLQSDFWRPSYPRDGMKSVTACHVQRFTADYPTFYSGFRNYEDVLLSSKHANVRNFCVS